MRSEELYNAWKDGKRKIDVGKGFADEVMDQVRRYEQGKSRRFAGLRLLVDVISEHPLAQAGLVVAGAVAGFVRVVLVVCMFLRC